MRKTAIHDSEVYSSDVFRILAEYEISRSARYPSPMGMLQIEMTPNASNADALRAAPAVFISALNAHLRSVDITSADGSEFKVLLPTTNSTGTETVCERLLSVFKNKYETNFGSVSFSLHIGATSHNGGPSLTTAGIFQNVEAALKQSKLKGPNTYVMIS
ncbi:diguanylate cyclase [Candidatus Villigracilis saccharophilus]|uniref:diguanylate cyclase domain-containing protein n=1 Tax=Candidatus Villigracilis saccharophilus TaxID=3140684 RepID=UPI00313543E9|nr:diguanylate cyclase [Anaerolineales bacterium]